MHFNRSLYLPDIFCQKIAVSWYILIIVSFDSLPDLEDWILVVGSLQKDPKCRPSAAELLVCSYCRTECQAIFGKDLELIPRVGDANFFWCGY